MVIKLFNFFFFVGNGSYGLGLILSHGNLLAHGGELWMTSQGEGKGWDWNLIKSYYMKKRFLDSNLRKLYDW